MNNLLKWWKNLSTDTTDRLLDLFQTIGIIATILLSLWIQHQQSNQNAATMMLQFDERFHSDKGSEVFTAIDESGNLNSMTPNNSTTDEKINCFLNDYELLAIAYEYNLIDSDMIQDAFAFELTHALKDPKVIQFIKDTRHDIPNAFKGVDYLNQQFGN